MLPLLRFTLDLFGTNQPPAPMNSPVDAIDLKSPASPTPHQLTLPPLTRHPYASHEITLGGVIVAYQLKRARRRSIGFCVGPHGLEVRAPRWIALCEVDVALQNRADWILRKLHEVGERRVRLASQQLDWRDGARFPYFGEPLTLRLCPAHRGGATGVEQVTLDLAHAHLYINLANDAHAVLIRDLVQGWLMQQARSHFELRLNYFAPQLGVQYRRLNLSNAATRWGSASADGAIRLNWRLLHLRPVVVDYVVVHELSHLRVMNHSAQFWNTVASIIPDYRELRQQLKTAVVPSWN